VKAKRYKLHWAGSSRESPQLKWQVWDWTLKHPVAHIESRIVGRLIVQLLNLHSKAGSTKSEAKSEAARKNGTKGGRPRNDWTKENQEQVDGRFIRKGPEWDKKKTVDLSHLKSDMKDIYGK